MAEGFNQAKSIFLEAVEEHAPGQWRAFLEQACAGDAVLRAEVERLLRAHAAMGTFRESSRPAHPAAAAWICEGPGTVLGPYRILGPIGEGGFGAVFLAEQRQPIRRLVALKVIKPGLDTAQVIARFEAERQALALMEHPHIARVLDAGATDSGRPYFVMELVQGVPITEFCDRNRLAPEARLRLFIDVCQAIQHAHHKGIIHRDIKPTNVLVTEQDGKPVVKVIDFGIAKAMAQPLTERPHFTPYGHTVGTPAYMSPEQTEGSGLDIDTRSDVYALGVLLYELLTGTTPLEASRLRGASCTQIQGLICGEEAPRTSSRFSRLALATSEGRTPGRSGLLGRLGSRFGLRKLQRRELDWIVMKALEKDRNRRYDTPGSFAGDVERYLRHEAVAARPPCLVYKLRKFVRRHRAGVLTAGAVVAALILGTVVATCQALRARQAEATARAAAEAERRARDDAEARAAEARAVLQFVVKRVLAAARPEGQAGGLGREVTLRKALEAALPFAEQDFIGQPLIEARLRLTLGESFWYLGEARTAAVHCERARALYTRHLGPDHPDTLRSMHHLARCYAALGRRDEALRLCEETLDRRKATLGPDHPDTLRSMNCLACRYSDLGRREEALHLRQQTLALLEARLGPDHPDTLRGMYNLAISYAAVGRQSEALRLREQTLARRKATLGPDHPETLRSMNGLACSYAAFNRHHDAVRLYEQTLALQMAKLGADHPDTFQTVYNLAISYAALGRHADALRLREEALCLHIAKLGREHPRTLMCCNNLARSYADVGRHADAVSLFEQTLALQRATLGAEHPDTLLTMAGLVDSLVQLGRGAEAVPVIDECVRHATSKILAPSVLPCVLDRRLRHFQKMRDAAGCRRTAEMWEALKRTDAASLYNSARMRAVTAAVLRAADPSTEGGKQADVEADQALVWLKQAVAAGYTDAARLSQDRDLESLHDRAGYATLVTELPSQAGKKPSREQTVR